MSKTEIVNILKDSKHPFSLLFQFSYHHKDNQLYQRSEVSSHQEEYTARPVWKDFHRGLHINGQSAEIFKSKFNWLKNLDTASNLSPEDKRYFDLIQDAKDLTFSNPTLNDEELYFFTIYLQDQLGEEGCKTFINSYQQGLGNTTKVWQDILNNASKFPLPPGIKDVFPKPEAQSHVYTLNGVTYSIGTTNYKDNYKDSSINRGDLRAQGKIKITTEGLLILETGSSKINSRIAKMKSGDKTSYQELVALNNAEIKDNEKIFVKLKQQLVKNFEKNSAKKSTTISKEILFLIDNIEKIKKVSSISLSSLNNTLVKVNQFLVNSSVSDKKLIEEIRHVSTLFLMDEQNKLYSNLQSLQTLEPKNSLRQKFELFYFGLLSPAIRNPQADFINLAKVLDYVSKIDFTKEKTATEKMELVNATLKAMQKDNVEKTIGLLSFFFYANPIPANLASVYNDILIFINNIDKTQVHRNYALILDIERIINFLKNPSQNAAKGIPEMITKYYHQLTTCKFNELKDQFSQSMLQGNRNLSQKIDTVIEIISKIIQSPNSKDLNLIGIINKISGKLTELTLEENEPGLLIEPDENEPGSLPEPDENEPGLPKTKLLENFLDGVIKNLGMAKEKINAQRNSVAKASSWSFWKKSSEKSIDLPAKGFQLH